MKLCYVVCVNNEGYPTSLDLFKLYRTLPDGEPELGLIRVVDESGESYLYPESRFVPMEVREGYEEAARRAFAGTVRSIG
ncbi:MAG: hypothetical protein H0V75_09360 [Rubrobacter sp.]|nr:hypothetical protein [Rubrobacter sp.]